MDKQSISFIETKEEKARRVAHAKGNSYNQTKDCQERWRAREKSDEQFARQLGINLDADSVRSHNCRMYR